MRAAPSGGSEGTGFGTQVESLHGAQTPFMYDKVKGRVSAQTCPQVGRRSGGLCEFSPDRVF